MNMQEKLLGPVNQSKNLTKNLVFFLHGWGSDGNDLIQISHHWENELNNISFFAPDGPEVCSENPSGKQWFNIFTEDKKEISKGLEKAYILLNEYINSQLSNYNLGKEDFFLVGFSQGTMLSLFTSIRKKCKGIIGYSGAFLDGELPENIIKNDILLIHGELDSVVPIIKMEEAKKKLGNMCNTIQTKSYSDLEHSINEDGLILGCDFIKKRL
ncbi:MAG: hypothetical protein CFH34_00225 [Alphaproteobacteria bacterium MarineAlpha9_Bin4]|nr:phospholipase [Pelagibacterales bacterium]MBF96702.1 phospholipase [Pelagibacterales bacterium]PPR27396.1 MAG: hypothetical protein CFH34_00225 [Alphaproteobacteria bacterium MarineAlpha9_Bin4]|tara:strand:- start:23 stop:661 length:639 start_codon:yes stop_codon:yes gene_type:complete